MGCWERGVQSVGQVFAGYAWREGKLWLWGEGMFAGTIAGYVLECDVYTHLFCKALAVAGVWQGFSSVIRLGVKLGGFSLAAFLAASLFGT
jgi:hypothetical protein